MHGMRMARTSVLLLCIGSLGFGVMLSSANSRPVQSTPAGSDKTTPNQNPSTSKKVTFQNIAPGEIEDEDHVHLGATLFKASDGNTLQVLYEDFGNSARARDYLEKRLAKAVKVVERKKKLSAAGRVVGERAEILLRLPSQEAVPAILWIDGVKFHEIFSASRDSILELEKVFRY
jgi:hypothetical protein